MKETRLLIGTLMLSLAASAAGAAGAPAIVVEASTRDFGTVLQGEKLDMRFVVANRGADALEITVRPTCGCTVVDHDRVIEAGASGEIHATIDTASFSGPMAKSIMVLSNDPRTPSLTLAVRAVITPVLEVLPTPLVRLDTARGTSATSTVVVTTSAAELGDFVITRVESGSSYVTAEVKRLEGDALLPGRGASQYEITLELSGNAPAGFVNTPVTLFTDHGNAATVQLKVVGTVRS